MKHEQTRSKYELNENGKKNKWWRLVMVAVAETHPPSRMSLQLVTTDGHHEGCLFFFWDFLDFFWSNC